MAWDILRDICLTKDASRSNMKMSGFRAIAAIVAALVTACVPLRFTTLETNFPSGPNGIILSIASDSTPARNREIRLTDIFNRGLSKRDLNSSSEKLQEFLESHGLKCTSAGDRQSCRGEFYHIVRMESGGPEDGVSRTDWYVHVTWLKTNTPIQVDVDGGWTRIQRLPDR